MKLQAIRTITPAGKLLNLALQLVFAVVHLFVFRSWRYARKNFEENPRTMKLKDVIYLGYKYYFKPHTHATVDGSIEKYFREQDLDFSPTDGYEPQQTCTLHAGGDLMPYRLVNSQTAKHIWDDAGDFFFSGDIVFANLETPLCPGKPAQEVPEIMLNDMYFNCSEEMFHIFSGGGKHKGYDVLSVANNHSLDMGEEGLEATLQYLKQNNIPYCGAATQAGEQNNFPLLERNGIRVAFLAYTYSLNQLLSPAGKEWMVNYLPLNVPGCDLWLIKKHCAMAREQGADFVVVSLHAGNAYQAYPSAHTIDLFHRVFDECGADIILGGHPHNPQPMETYVFTDPHSGKKKKGFAIYSLADFVAHDVFTWCHLPILLRLQLSKGILNGKPESRILAVQVMPVYNHYDAAEKKLRLIPLTKALQMKPRLGKAAQQELDELEQLCNTCFLPGKRNGLLV